MVTNFKIERIRDREHLDWVKTLPCLVCKSTPCDPDHVNLPMQGTKGKQASDSQTVPLCRPHHTLRHNMPVAEFYREYVGRTVEEIVELGEELYKGTGNTDLALWNLLGFRK